MENLEVKTVVDTVKGLIDNAMTSKVGSDDLKKALTEAKSEIEKLSKEQIKEANEAIQVKFAELQETLVKQSKEIDSLKSSSFDKKVGIDAFAEKIVNSDEFKSYASNPHGSSKKIEVKTVDLTSSYTGGTALLTQDSGRRVVQPTRPINMRDIMTVGNTNLPYIVFSEITGFVNAINVLAENTSAPESSFSVVETTVQKTRIASFIDMSKDMLKSTSWVASQIKRLFPAKLREKEDFEILFGEGANNHLNGLWKNAQAFTAGTTSFSAGAFATVASWAAGTQAKVTFAAAHGLWNSGSLTIANSTAYNATHNYTVISATEILLNTAYTAEAGTAVDDWTGTATHAFNDAIDNANKYDAIRVTIASMQNKYYKATGIVMNNLDATDIELLKSTTGEYLDPKAIERINGILYISGIPVVETDAMPTGMFLVGDFQNGVQLVDYETATVFMSEDVTYDKANKVAIIIESGVMMPIYNKYSIYKGVFATIMANIEKP